MAEKFNAEVNRLSSLAEGLRCERDEARSALVAEREAREKAEHVVGTQDIKLVAHEKALRAERERAEKAEEALRGLEDRIQALRLPDVYKSRENRSYNRALDDLLASLSAVPAQREEKCRYCDKPAAQTYAGQRVCAEPSECRAKLGPPVPPPEPKRSYADEHGDFEGNFS